ncbi:hypothetical protein BH23BAC1_BH23BAC1_07990 [soil metagenome]
MNLKILLFYKIKLLVLIYTMTGCGSHNEEYLWEKNFSQEERDTIMADIVTYIYIKPKTANWQTRHESRFRSYYVNKISLFEMDQYYYSGDSIHYFFMIRPARSPKGNKRGVGGKFKMNEEMKISEFEELFNTPVMAEDSIKLVGNTLFQEMIKSGNVDYYLQNSSLIEWPDERLKYNKAINDWDYLN